MALPLWGDRPLRGQIGQLGRNPNSLGHPLGGPCPRLRLSIRRHGCRRPRADLTGCGLYLFLPGGFLLPNSRESAFLGPRLPLLALGLRNGRVALSFWGDLPLRGQIGQLGRNPNSLGHPLGGPCPRLRLSIRRQGYRRPRADLTGCGLYLFSFGGLLLPSSREPAFLGLRLPLPALGLGNGRAALSLWGDRPLRGQIGQLGRRSRSLGHPLDGPQLFPRLGFGFYRRHWPCADLSGHSLNVFPLGASPRHRTGVRLGPHLAPPLCRSGRGGSAFLPGWDLLVSALID